MPITRRQLLAATTLVPIGLTVSVLALRAEALIQSAAPAMRPAASGTSATRCALCGAGDHAMLDPRCPGARQVI
jgi:hypothetical protein